MKKQLYFLALVTVVVCTLVTACGNKKMQNSTAKIRIDKPKKDSTETHRRPNENNVVVVKKVTTKNPVATAKIPTSDNSMNYTPLPPDAVETAFKSRYPSATDIQWTKEPINNSGSKNVVDYKVNFLIDQNKYSAIYSEKGSLVELREQILPDQLPPNIYTAIKNKYPNVHIVYASTCKNKKNSGSYAAIIRVQSIPDDIEVLLMENGTFIK